MDKHILTKARRRLLRMHYESCVGHLGGNLSCLDIIMTLYHDVMTLDDVFILSKGHSAGALYVVLNSKELMTDEQLSTFHKDGGLPGHASSHIDGITFSTGSLGHGISLGCGLALAKKLKHEDGRIFVLCSDGEIQEGSSLEGIQFAASNELSNLIVIIDNNGIQGIDTTDNVMGSGIEISDKMNAFGALVLSINGHDSEHISRALTHHHNFTVVIADTIKGNGVSFMEDKVSWHYLPMDEDQYNQALEENK